MGISLSEIRKAIPNVAAPALDELTCQLELALDDMTAEHKRACRQYKDVLNEIRGERRRRGLIKPKVSRIEDDGFVRYNLLGLAHRRELLNPVYDWTLVCKQAGRIKVLDYMQIHVKTYMLKEDLVDCNLKYVNGSSAYTLNVVDALAALVEGASLFKLEDTRKRYKTRATKCEQYLNRLCAGRREGPSNEAEPDILKTT